ncbi:MAG: 3-hydroxyacyl-ACP dehydratase FabZ family protein [Planctomycetia bacterium]|nr:3-hydroxyacyl-ACP dehydratase FabZ family protein [Planctomycetia bacterium]
MNNNILDDPKRQQIYDAIPHRPPFLFIDEIKELTNDHIICIYQFKEDEFFFQGHYPGSPIVPGVILCESAMQAGAILLSNYFKESDSESKKIPVVGRMNDIKFKQLVRPGDTIQLEVELREKMKNAYFLNAKIITNDKQLIVRFEFVCTITERPAI